MKTSVLFTLALIFSVVANSQPSQLKQNLKTEKAVFWTGIPNESTESDLRYHPKGQSPSRELKHTNGVSVVPLGTSANAYSYGYHGGQRAIINVDNELGIITHNHRMGGWLDPGQFSGDLGIDISYDHGITWDCMIEIHTANVEIPGIYCNPVDVARYPNHGIFNPPGNTNPNEAYAVFFAPITWCIDCGTWGGYIFGTSKIGDPSITTKTMFCSDTALGIHQNVPDGFTIKKNGGFWAIDYNVNLVDESWMHALIINHGTWNEQAEEFGLQQDLLPCITLTADVPPPCNRVEFSPDGQIGYIVVLTDIGAVELSANWSLYPVLYKTEDAGETWGNPIPVALAGENGLESIQGFLSDDELEELFIGNPPERDQIEFTTAFDFDLSVDAFGNPHIAVVVGVTGFDPYSIITEISASSGKMFTASFLLSSMDKGEPGSWLAYELGRPVSFRGSFDEDDNFVEDNRIQISRNHSATKMFVSWLDTDLEVSDENNHPNIWARGVDVVNHTLTANEVGDALPNNVTHNSVAADSACFFAMGNEVIENEGIYTIAYTYEDMDQNDPFQEVQYKYIQDFRYTDTDFQIVGIDEKEIEKLELINVSPAHPNPAETTFLIQITLGKPATVETSVSNMMGQVVQRIHKQVFHHGVNDVIIDVSELSPGIYFYTVKIDSRRITKKLIVK